MDDLVERLQTARDDDHERGCQMRFVVCSCGYDDLTARAVAEAADRIEALQAEVALHECLNVSAYRAGMKAGWNYCDANDLEGYQRAMEGTEHIAELKRLRQALKGSTDE